MTLVDRVLRTIRDESLISTGDHVLCAVSGGADSVALLHALHTLSASLGFTLSAAHVNHMLRGEESDRDEAFVRSLCDSLQIPLYAERICVADLARERGIGIEEAAREARYDFFAKQMAAHGINVLATAHTAKDQLETVIHHLARGTGLSGLSGIPISRSFSAGRLVRPLLMESREAVEQYLMEQGSSYVTDSSNLSDDYTRNRIRHQVLPALEALNPSLYETTARSLQLIRSDADFIGSAVDQAWERLVRDSEVDADALCALHPSISGRLVMRLYQTLLPDGPQLTAANVQEVLSAARSQSPSAYAMLPGGVVARREYGVLRFTAETAPAALFTRTLTPGETLLLPEAELLISSHFAPKSDINLRNVQNLYFDSSHICGILSVRARLPGDRIHLAGHDHSKSLKKALMDAKIPQAKRDLVPVICDEQGIAAVAGMGTAQRLAVTEDTQTVLVIEIKKLMEDTKHDNRI